jgi:hypothetical protein
VAVSGVRGGVSLSGRSTYVAERIDSCPYPVASLIRGGPRVIGPCKVGASDGQINYEISQRSGVLSDWRGIIRLALPVTHQRGRPTVRKPANVVDVERILVPALSVHAGHATPRTCARGNFIRGNFIWVGGRVHHNFVVAHVIGEAMEHNCLIEPVVERCLKLRSAHATIIATPGENR